MLTYRYQNVLTFPLDSFLLLGLPKVRQQPYTINPGDSFETKFWFNSKNGTDFGKGSSQEMNEVFLLYYPAKRILDFAPWGCTYEAPLGACNSTMSTRVLTSDVQLERVFGSNPAQCRAKATPPDDITSTSAVHTDNSVITFTILSFLSSLLLVWWC
jgi:hypothetical protein